MTGCVAQLPEPVQSSVCSFQYHTADTCCPSGHWRYKTNDIDYIRSIGIDPCPVASPVCTFENDGVLCNSISCIFICKKILIDNFHCREEGAATATCFESK